MEYMKGNQFVLSRRKCLAISIFPVISGCLSGGGSSPDTSINELLIENNINEPKSVRVSVENGGEEVYRENHSVGPDETITISEGWMEEPGNHILTAETRINGKEVSASGQPVPRENEDGTCVEIRINSDGLDILQPLGENHC